MDAIDYVELAQDTQDVIAASGRSIQISKLSATPADNAKPWRGVATGGPQKIDTENTFGVFVVPATSVPTQSRGMGLDWIDQQLLSRANHVCLIAAKDLPALDDFKVITDGTSDWTIIWGQCLQPGTVRLLYAFGVEQ